MSTSPNNIVVSPTTRKQGFINCVRREPALYILALPGVLYFLVFKYVPMWGALIAFKDYSIFDGFLASPWVGFENFTQMFGLYGFQQAFTNTIIISFLKLGFGFPVPIILSLLLNEVRFPRYKKLMQTIIFLPFFISWVVIAGILYSLLAPQTGAIREVFDVLGVGWRVPPFFSDGATFRALLVGSHIWRNAGLGTVLYLATISTIDTEMYESAVMDGATRWQQAIHITLPHLASTIVILFIFRVGQMLDVDFEQVFALYNPLVYSAAEILDTYIYKVGVGQAQYSIATTAGLFKSVIGLGMVLLANWGARKVDPEKGLF